MLHLFFLKTCISSNSRIAYCMYEDINDDVVVEGSDWDTANIFSKWTFSVAYNMLRLGLQKPLQYDDLMQLPKHDHSNTLIPDLEKSYGTSICVYKFPRLLVAVFYCHKDIIYLTGFYTFLEGVLRIACPVVLGYFLAALQDSSTGRTSAFLLAFAISILNLLQAVTHHILFFYTMRLGYNFRTSTVGMIFDTLFKLPGGALDSSEIDTGVLVNLISNDVARFDEAAVVILIFHDSNTIAYEWFSVFQYALGAYFGSNCHSNSFVFVSQYLLGTSWCDDDCLIYPCTIASGKGILFQAQTSSWPY